MKLSCYRFHTKYCITKIKLLPISLNDTLSHIFIHGEINLLNYTWKLDQIQ